MLTTLTGSLLLLIALTMGSHVRQAMMRHHRLPSAEVVDPSSKFADSAPFDPVAGERMASYDDLASVPAIPAMPAAFADPNKDGNSLASGVKPPQEAAVAAAAAAQARADAIASYERQMRRQTLSEIAANTALSKEYRLAAATAADSIDNSESVNYYDPDAMPAYADPNGFDTDLESAKAADSVDGLDVYQRKSREPFDAQLYYSPADSDPAAPAAPLRCIPMLRRNPDPSSPQKLVPYCAPVYSNAEVAAIGGRPDRRPDAMPSFDEYEADAAGGQDEYYIDEDEAILPEASLMFRDSVDIRRPSSSSSNKSSDNPEKAAVKSKSDPQSAAAAAETDDDYESDADYLDRKSKERAAISASKRQAHSDEKEEGPPKDKFEFRMPPKMQEFKMPKLPDFGNAEWFSSMKDDWMKDLPKFDAIDEQRPMQQPKKWVVKTRKLYIPRRSNV